MQSYYAYPQNPQDYIAHAEKTQIRRTANSVGLAMIAVSVIPFLWSFIYMGVMRLFGFSYSTTVSLLRDPTFLQLLQIGLSAFIFVLPFGLVAAGERRQTTRLIEFKRPKKGLFLPYVLIGVGVCAFANIATSRLADFFSAFGFSYSQPDLEVPGGVYGMILVFLSSAFAPALVEEFAMRGVVMGSLRKFGEEFAIVVSAILFGLMHGNFIQIPFAFLIGLAVGVATMKTGSFWTGVAIHFINNLIATILEMFLPSDMSVYLQNLIYSIYIAICLLSAFVGIALMHGKGTDAISFHKSDLQATNHQKCRWFFSTPAVIVAMVFIGFECLLYLD